MDGNCHNLSDQYVEIAYKQKSLLLSFVISERTLVHDSQIATVSHFRLVFLFVLDEGGNKGRLDVMAKCLENLHSFSFI